MALIKIELDYPLEDGMSLTFKAPCDCTAVTGIKIYYPELATNAPETEIMINSRQFFFMDAHLNPLTNLGNLFEAGATVKVILDTVNQYAFIQNADTNKYLEDKINALAVDYVVEQDWDGSEGWRKWNSGTVEWWGTRTFNAREGDTHELPFKINNAAVTITPDARLQEGIDILYAGYVTLYDLCIVPTLPQSSQADGQVSCHVHIFGRWK